MPQTWFCNLRPTKAEGTILLDPQVSGARVLDEAAAAASFDVLHVAGMTEHPAVVSRLVSERGLPARLHQQGHVIGWDTTWLHVCMDHDRALVILRADLVRVLDWPRGS